MKPHAQVAVIGAVSAQDPLDGVAIMTDIVKYFHCLVSTSRILTD